MKKLVYNDQVLEKGNFIEDSWGVEGGIIVGINYDREEVYVHDYKEGWTMNAEYENMGPLKFVTT